MHHFLGTILLITAMNLEMWHAKKMECTRRNLLNKKQSVIGIIILKLLIPLEHRVSILIHQLLLSHGTIRLTSKMTLEA